MDFRFTPEQEALRREVREFLEEEIRKGTFKPRSDGWICGYSPEFSRKLGERGWIGMTWPKEYGGGGRTYVERLIVTEELLRYGAPTAYHWFADRQIGPTLLAYGTEEQKRYFLPRMAKGEIGVAVGMSEPEAGSDLASIRTRAIETDKGFIINGQKIWTSGAHCFDYIYLVAVTDPQGPRYKNISEFLIDFSLPGITVRPLIDLTGEHHFNEVFFDDVLVPKDALIGKKNEGWKQIMEQLDYERSGIERLMSNYPAFEFLISHCKETGKSKNPVIRNKLAQLRIEFEVGRMLIYRVAWLLDQGKIPNYEAAMAKFFATDFEKRLAAFAMDVLGPLGQLKEGSKWWKEGFGLITGSYFFSPGYTIQGGTSEILRNIVALRGLGLSR